MSRAAALLRALLCLALLLNGTGYAHAATRMAMGTLADSTPVETKPPCHGDATMAMEHAPPEATVSDDAPAMSDCCTSDSCDGPCMQHAPALPWPALIAPMRPVPSSAPSYRASAHASALLTHRHRPPIFLA
ncbi:CopL family metal-binding regulatory protein [Pseudoxanthomonas putridarboris]|uniref:CopL family metal-binding regulatory protein n=1 Tax=Pseudoxanthomonas putridarboris TaxID=752605 RepID=A0ABU9J0X8_9GAMM